MSQVWHTEQYNFYVQMTANIYWRAKCKLFSLLGYLKLLLPLKLWPQRGLGMQALSLSCSRCY